MAARGRRGGSRARTAEVATVVQEVGQTARETRELRERAIQADVLIRYAKFLEAELQLIPGWHPMHAFYREQLDRLGDQAAA